MLTILTCWFWSWLPQELTLLLVLLSFVNMSRASNSCYAQCARLYKVQKFDANDPKSPEHTTVTATYAMWSTSQILCLACHLPPYFNSLSIKFPRNLQWPPVHPNMDLRCTRCWSMVSWQIKITPWGSGWIFIGILQRWIVATSLEKKRSSLWLLCNSCRKG